MSAIDRKHLDHKSSVAPIQWKAAAAGHGRAVFSTFGVVDHQGDVTLAGAMPVGKRILISSYGHSSWEDALPIGKGVIAANDREAWVDFELFLNTPQGSAHYETLKALGELCEWSYGFKVTEESFDRELLERYGKGARRLIVSVDVFEASPVFRGAGVNTRTESLKCTGCSGGSSDGGSLEPDTRAELQRIFLFTLKLRNDERLRQLREDEATGESQQRALVEDLARAFKRRTTGWHVRHALAIGSAEWVSEAEMGRRASIARSALKHATWSLGLDAPPDMTFFRDTARKLDGQAFHDRKEIYVRADLDGARLVQVVAHEVAHIATPHASEDEVDAWAAGFAARNPDLIRGAAA